MLLPLHQLVFKPNMPAGMDLAVVGLWVATTRKCAAPVNPPILVKRFPDCDHWLVDDGRHRAIGSYIAGRTCIEAEEQP